jgi:hypothetical protein
MPCGIYDKMAARLMLFMGWAVSAAIIEEKRHARAVGPFMARQSRMFVTKRNERSDASGVER